MIFFTTQIMEMEKALAEAGAEIKMNFLAGMAGGENYYGHSIEVDAMPIEVAPDGDGLYEWRKFYFFYTRRGGSPERGYFAGLVPACPHCRFPAVRASKFEDVAGWPYPRLIEKVVCPECGTDLFPDQCQDRTPFGRRGGFPRERSYFF